MSEVVGTPPTSAPAIRTPSSGEAISVRMLPRRVTAHPVLDQELTALQNASPATPLTFFGIWFGAAVSFASVVFTQKLPTDANAIFLTLFVGAVVLGVYFLVKSAQAIRDTNSLVREIRSRSTTDGEVPLV